MRTGYLSLSATLFCVVFASCGKDIDVLTSQKEPVPNVSKVLDLDPLRKLQDRGFFRTITLPEDKSLRSYSIGTEEEEKALSAFLESPEALEVVCSFKENPFLGLKNLRSYEDLSESQKKVISLLAQDSTIIAFYHEGLHYLDIKGQDSLRVIVYSQMLHAGPEHAEGSKQVLKFVGNMVIGALSSKVKYVGGAVLGGAAYLLDLL